jgi:hypothetical protein
MSIEACVKIASVEFDTVEWSKEPVAEMTY